MVSGMISDGQITASSHMERTWVSENARLLIGRSAWTLPPQAQPYVNEWLQVDLGQEKLLRGLIIQGGKHRDNKVFVRKFRVGYSNNGSDWKMIQNASGTGKPKVSWTDMLCQGLILLIQMYIFLSQTVLYVCYNRNS